MVFQMEMQLLDWMILLGCITAAVGGYRLGFIARVTSWVGIIGGIAVAITVLPWILRNAAGLSDMSRLGLVVLLVLLGTLFGQMVGLLVGSRISESFMQDRRLKLVDQFTGLVAGVFGVLLALWLILPTAADVPGWSAQQVRSSEVAQRIDTLAPDPPDAVKNLRRLVGSQTFQPVFEGLAPAPDTGPPPAEISLPRDVVQRVGASTVKVEGVACRRTQNGSGFSVGQNLFATNAHVVAGQTRTSVVSPDDEKYDAIVVAYDDDRDLALLYTPRYHADPLPLASTSVGDVGAVFGHPGGQDALNISPASVNQIVRRYR